MRGGIERVGWGAINPQDELFFCAAVAGGREGQNIVFQIALPAFGNRHAVLTIRVGVIIQWQNRAARAASAEQEQNCHQAENRFAEISLFHCFIIVLYCRGF